MLSELPPLPQAQGRLTVASGGEGATDSSDVEPKTTEPTSQPEEPIGSAIFYGAIWMACHHDANSHPPERVTTSEVEWFLYSAAFCHGCMHVTKHKGQQSDTHSTTARFDVTPETRQAAVGISE